ncbi:MAG: ribosome small subunit-dependent GTPase A [Methylophilus sp.]
MLNGLVVAAFGKRFEVELEDQRRISCVTRGKKTDIATGDFVEIKLTDTSEGVIEKTLERKSLLYRSNAYKSKLLAANVTQIVIVLATQPSFYEALLNKCLVAAEAAHIKALIVLNKCDLKNDEAIEKLKTYEALGYQTVQLSAKADISPLLPFLKNHQSVLVGQSGMGKSTIINTLLPNENARTQEISSALDSGKHTTTATRFYHLDKSTSLIDSPGLQEFGLHHISQEELEHAFIEFRPYLGHCRFSNCKHVHEPDCAILAQVSLKKITERRLSQYHSIEKEIHQTL